MSKTYRIATIPGDGIGNEVVPEGQRVLEAAARKHGGFRLDWTHFDWSCERFLKTGRMMPEDGIDRLRGFDAIYLGAVGFPGVPDPSWCDSRFASFSQNTTANSSPPIRATWSCSGSNFFDRWCRVP